MIFILQDIIKSYSKLSFLDLDDKSKINLIKTQPELSFEQQDNGNSMNGQT